MKKYRTAYVIQPSGHSFQPILEHCDEIRFLTTGYESDESLPQIIQNALKEYDPEKDVLVPVGNVATNVLAGIQVENIREEKRAKHINLAFYRDKQYIIKKYNNLLKGNVQ